MEKEEVKQFCKDNNFTQKELAEISDVSEDYISKIERGVLPVTEYIEKQIKDYKFKQEMDDLEEDPEPAPATMEEVLIAAIKHSHPEEDCFFEGEDEDEENESVETDENAIEYDEETGEVISD